MENFIQNCISVLLQAIWAVHLLFKKTHRIKRASLEDASPNQRKSKFIINYKRNERTKRPPTNVLFNLKRGSSLLNVSDLITPHEEEMIRCLCAKGCQLNQEKIDQLAPDSYISRGTFTDIWIDSCSTV